MSDPYNPPNISGRGFQPLIQLPPISSLGSVALPASPSLPRTESRRSIESPLSPQFYQTSTRDPTPAEYLRLQNHYMQLQQRCSALETKSALADNEVSSLVEEKSQLSQQISALTSQIAEMTRQKASLQEQMHIDGSQWRQIMSMSSRLQAQHVEESRSWSKEKGNLQQERDRLLHCIKALREGKMDEHMVNSLSAATTASSSHVADEKGVEIERLRLKCERLEGMLRAIIKESNTIDQTMHLLQQIRRYYAEVEKD